jgi:hypothetical protein
MIVLAQVSTEQGALLELVELKEKLNLSHKLMEESNRYKLSLSYVFNIA